jgi:DNA polymerase sigma
MPTLYVEDVPADLYEAIRAKAKQNRSSISAEVLKLLAAGVPTQTELARRQAIGERLRELRSRPSSSDAPVTSTEDLLREDRSR